MSRTYKDKPYRLRFPEHYKHWEDSTYTPIPGSWHRLVIAGAVTKKPRFHKPWKWTSSMPSWHTRLYMTRPKRRRCRVWETKTALVKDLDLVDCPDYGHKPLVYYW